MIFDSIGRLFSYDLGVDLGTAYTSVYVKGKGIITNEPSVVVMKDDGKEARQVVAVGGQAKNMVGRTPNRIKAIRPIKDGVIADFQAAQMMLEYFIKKANNNRKGIVKSRIVLSVPIEINEIEKKALIESAKVAGASEVYLLEAVIGAAIGAGLSVEEPVGNMIVDIGAGKTEIAVISLGGIVVGKSLSTGGDSMDQAIVHYVKNRYNRVIGEGTAESVKIKLGQTLNDGNNGHIKMNLSDLSVGIPTTMDISSEVSKIKVGKKCRNKVKYKNDMFWEHGGAIWPKKELFSNI
ncbi:MAG: rod shape-determining protein MreB [Deltaproteobacteria bacterium]|nr:rod shape-determining protein MreB [Deltaproteobacteria bacterium]